MHTQSSRGHSQSHSQEVKCGAVTEGQREELSQHLELLGHFCCHDQDCWVMAAAGVFLSLAVCALLGHQIQAKNTSPCQASKWNNGFRTFFTRHIRSGTPNSLDQNQWEAYIRDNGGCDRPTQSFIHPDDLDRVKAVCSNKGGKVLKENLCISQQPFSFVTVRSEPGTCGIRSIRQETKHLILACEVLENQCLPVHFEGNSENLKPSNNARGCQDPQTKGHANGLKMTWLWLLCVVPVVIYGY